MAHPRIEPLKKILAIDPNDEVAWFGLGKAYLEDANYGEAITALQSCIRAKPTYSAAYLALAQAFQKSGQFDQCREACDQGIEVSSKNGDAMVTKNLGLLKQSLGS